MNVLPFIAILIYSMAFSLWMDGVNWKVCAPGSSLVNEDFREMVIRLRKKKYSKVEPSSICWLGKELPWRKLEEKKSILKNFS